MTWIKARHFEKHLYRHWHLNRVVDSGRGGVRGESDWSCATQVDSNLKWCANDFDLATLRCHFSYQHYFVLGSDKVNYLVWTLTDELGTCLLAVL